MLSAFSRFWTVVKATLAIGLLAAGSLYSAQIVDRRGVNSLAAALAEPTTTGSIKPNQAITMTQDGQRASHSVGGSRGALKPASSPLMPSGTVFGPRGTYASFNRGFDPREPGRSYVRVGAQPRHIPGSTPRGVWLGDEAHGHGIEVRFPLIAAVRTQCGHSHHIP